MGDHVTELKEGSFDAFIAKGNVVVDFWAEWCGPCKILSPIVDQVAGELKGKVKFGKVDVESEQDLQQRFEVMSIPTLIFFKDGEMVDRCAGAIPKETLLKKIKEAF